MNEFEYKNSSKFLLHTFKPNQKSLDYVNSFINQFDLVIGYELSKCTREIIDSLNIKYIDVWLSPIRFLNDLKFCFSSNDIRINELFLKSKVDIQEIYSKANLITQNHLIENSDEDNTNNKSNMIVTQSLEDKSIIKDGRYLSLNDFHKELKQICSNYSINYILKHPNLSKKSFNKICDNIGVPNIEPIYGRGYQMLASKTLHHLIAISSSLLEEAKFFGKKITYLYKPVIDSNYILANEEIFSSNFWSKVLNLNLNLNHTFIHHDNYFRNILGKSWAYEEYLKNESSIYEYKVILKFLNKLKELDNNTEYTLLGLGTITKFIIDYNLLKVKRVLEANADCDKYAGIDVVSINNIERGENIIVTPFYDASKVIHGIKIFRPKIHQINF